jgi:hypothetical protein
MEPMRGRRFWLWALLVVLIAAGAAAIAPRDDVRPRPGVDTVVSGPPAHTVTGRLPARRPVVAAVGDVVSLSVSASEPDEAQILPLAVHAPAEPGVPAQLEFVAGSRGRFPVVLRDSDKRVGTVVIR